MKTVTIKLMSLYLLFVCISNFASCKKGEEDPTISFRSRKSRFVNEWTLVKYEKNGVKQSLDNATFIYDTYKDGKLEETLEGAIFGMTVLSFRSGIWEFVSDKEEVKITIDNNITTYQIQRLADKELWLKKEDGSDTYLLYFDGK